MAALARDKDITVVDRHSGDINYPIWLLINPKYPSVINNIWSHVLEVIQDKVYRELHDRIDTTNIYIRPVVSDCGIVPNTLNWWGNKVAAEMRLLRENIFEYNPMILITFGAFPFEFLRRVFEVKPEKGPKYWSASNLRGEFEKLIEIFDVNQANRIPLLRRVIASDKFLETKDDISGNDKEQYFQYVGKMISEKIIQNKGNLNIWIK